MLSEQAIEKEKRGRATSAGHQHRRSIGHDIVDGSQRAETVHLIALPPGRHSLGAPADHRIVELDHHGLAFSTKLHHPEGATEQGFVPGAGAEIQVLPG